MEAFAYIFHKQAIAYIAQKGTLGGHARRQKRGQVRATYGIIAENTSFNLGRSTASRLG